MTKFALEWSLHLLLGQVIVEVKYILQKETGSALTHVGAHLDLSAFSSWEELASLGLDRLKSALMALGLKCGG
jgi:poly-gamma-glutamate capsule biosynthesis protein CapA/YwtB (metallophosphatase superfamily)